MILEFLGAIKSDKAILGIPSLFFDCCLRVINLFKTSVLSSLVYNSISSSFIELAGNNPKIPFALNKFSLIILSRMILASSNSCLACFPLISFLKIAGYIP